MRHRPDLQPHAEAEPYADPGITLQPEHIVRAAEDVEGQGQARERHAHHVQRPQRLPRLMIHAVQDLGYPEAVDREDHVPHIPACNVRTGQHQNAELSVGNCPSPV